MNPTKLPPIDPLFFERFGATQEQIERTMAHPGYEHEPFLLLALAELRDEEVIVPHFLDFLEPLGQLTEEIGGHTVWRGRVEATLVAPADEHWNLVQLLRFPSRASMIEMVQRPEFIRINEVRQRALAANRMLAMESADAAAFDLPPDHDEHAAATTAAASTATPLLRPGALSPDPRVVASLTRHRDYDTEPVLLMVAAAFGSDRAAEGYIETWAPVHQRVLTDVGGKMVWYSRTGETLIGDEEPHWDAVALEWYPSRAALVGLITDRTHLAADPDRVRHLSSTMMLVVGSASAENFDLRD